MHGFKSVRIKGSSLFYTLVIATILAILCTALIAFIVFQRSISDLQELQSHLILNTDSGIELLLSGDLGSNQMQDSFDLFDNLEDSVLIVQKQWGALDLNLVTAFKNTDWGRKEFTKIFLSGHKPDSIERSAIYLKAIGESLNVAGKTSIVGDAYLPPKGIVAGYVKTEGFTGKKLIEGQVKKSNRVLPTPKKDFTNWLERQLKTVSSNQNIPDSLSSSFSKKTVVFSGDEIYLDSEFFKGNIVLKASKKIIVGTNCTLENVILIAPNIEIEEGFEGTIQAFASEKLTVSKNVFLDYPSVLGLISSGQVFSSPTLKIEENAEINGLIIGYQKNDQSRFPIRMKFEKESLIHGQVYCSGAVEPYGEIYGNITCGSFRLERKGGTFSNYLFDAKIDASELSKHFLMSSAIRNPNRKKEIMKWLN